MNFRAAFYNPFKPYVINIGDMPADKVIEAFEKIPWAEYLEKMIGKKPDEIHYSPSFEVENKENKSMLTISAVGTPTAIDYFIFYKRSKKVKVFFGLSEKIKENYLSEINKQTYQDAMNILHAFLKNNSDFLEGKIK